MTSKDEYSDSKCSKLKSAPRPPEFVDGEVFEVLPGFGLAHLRTADGRILGINRRTSVIAFSQVREGVRLRCEVCPNFNRVLRAELIG